MARPIPGFIGAYCRLLLFAVALLLGIQVPSFIDQYSKRIDAHFLEVSNNISGFQTTADLMFAGNIEGLIDYYENSADPVFRSDALSIRNIVNRHTRLAAELQFLQEGQLKVFLHLLFSADSEFVNETINDYSYTVPLNTIAIQWGVLLAILFILLTDFCWFGCRYCVGALGRRKKKAVIKTA